MDKEIGFPSHYGTRRTSYSRNAQCMFQYTQTLSATVGGIVNTYLQKIYSEPFLRVHCPQNVGCYYAVNPDYNVPRVSPTSHLFVRVALSRESLRWFVVVSVEQIPGKPATCHGLPLGIPKLESGIEWLVANPFLGGFLIFMISRRGRTSAALTCARNGSGRSTSQVTILLLFLRQCTF